MDLGDITQLVVVVTTAFALGRVVSALARLIERRASAMPALAPEADERLRALEEECSTLRQELAELAERQDFTERALVQDPGRVRPFPPQGARERIVTPH
jgi:hypothetical protein